MVAHAAVTTAGHRAALTQLNPPFLFPPTEVGGWREQGGWIGRKEERRGGRGRSDGAFMWMLEKWEECVFAFGNTVHLGSQVGRHCAWS